MKNNNPLLTKRLSLLGLCMVVLLFIVHTVNAQVHVNGYYRSNGTYVAPHVRSSPDGNPYNNYSYPGNVNPYTGKTATGNESTYLNNYYNRSSGSSSSTTSSNTQSTYTPSTYTPPSYTPSTYTPPSTYSPSTYSSPNSSSSYNGANTSVSSSSSYTSGELNSEGNADLLNSLIYNVSSTELNVRRLPDVQSSVVYKLKYGNPVMVVSIEDYPWCKVIFYTYDNITLEKRMETGFVHSKYLTKSDFPHVDNSNNGYINNDDNNSYSSTEVPYTTSIIRMPFDPPLLSGPNISYNTIYKCPQGNKVTVLKKGDVYYMIKINGIVGYISKKVLLLY